MVVTYISWKGADKLCNLEKIRKIIILLCILPLLAGYGGERGIAIDDTTVNVGTLKNPNFEILLAQGIKVAIEHYCFSV